MPVIEGYTEGKNNYKVTQHLRLALYQLSNASENAQIDLQLY